MDVGSSWEGALMAISYHEYVAFVEKVARLTPQHVVTQTPAHTELQLVFNILIEEAKEIETQCADGAFNPE